LSDFFLCLFQNTYTNAEKLLAAAEELAQTGECNAEDIYRYTASLPVLWIWIRDPVPF
jgi:kalirin